MLPDAPAVYDTVMLGDQEIPVHNNIACERSIVEGDADAAFAQADVVVGGVFKLAKIYHAQMETKSVVCRPEANGGLTVWCTTQSIHNVRILLGQIFDIPLSKINVIRTSIGGTFGSSIQMNSPIPIGVALARKARRPVKLTLTREEDMHDHTKYPAIIDLQLAARTDGTLLGAKMEIVADIGAHIVQAYSFLGVMPGWLVSLYKLPNLLYHGVAVYTNKSPSCAMQGYGNPQMTFAVESLIDELADRVGMDPLELRLKNYVGLGQTFWGQGPLVRSVVQSDGVAQLLHDGAQRIGWGRRCSTPSPAAVVQDGRRFRRGIGLGRGFHTSSAGAPQPGDVIDLLGRHDQGQPGRLDRHHQRGHGPRRWHAGGHGQVGGRDPVRATGQGQPGAGRDLFECLRRGDACDTRRLRRRRRGRQGGPRGAPGDPGGRLPAISTSSPRRYNCVSTPS